MSKTAIRIQNVSKKYLIGKQKDGSLRGTLSALFQANKQKLEEFYALQDVSFDVMQGDVVGIIGKNGAGKSTLLKILSQITKPSSGRIELNGRVASLLEVGTGFHPELTGRENIYLNGTILGMTRKEVTQKFDEIVAFSGVEKFIDTPVKHYSSGMYVRLAFAVAAHLEPEILIIDEVLAVGDAEFQKKCLGKMKDVAGEGRTVLFVSHDLGAVKQLCTKGVLLINGQIKTSETIETAIDDYVNSSKKINPIIPNRNKEFYLSNFYINFDKNFIAYSESDVSFVICVEATEDIKGIQIGIGINDIYGARLFTPFTMHFNNSFDLVKGTNSFTCYIESLPLKPGVYGVELYLGDGYRVFDYHKDSLRFEVLSTGSTNFKIYPNETQGSYLINQLWKRN